MKTKPKTITILPMPTKSHSTTLRVRYSETDRMGGFYNSRALEWFECGRTELLRNLGLSYADIESKGVFLPLVEAHAEFIARATYDDELRINTIAKISGKARIRFDMQIHRTADEKEIVRGYTVHAFTNDDAKPIRPPKWIMEKLALSE